MAFAAILAAAIAVGVACGGGGGKAPTKTPAPQATASPSAQYLMKVQLTDSDNGATVKLALGGQLIITLESNPSTGFSWLLAGLAGPELQLVGAPEYVPPESKTPVVGAAGTQVFTFATTGLGMPPQGQPAVVQVALEYKRSFEPDVPPAKKFGVTVEIK